MVGAVLEEEVLEVVEVEAVGVAAVAIKGVMTPVLQKKLLNLVTSFIRVKMT